MLVFLCAPQLKSVYVYNTLSGTEGAYFTREMARDAYYARLAPIYAADPTFNPAIVSGALLKDGRPISWIGVDNPYAARIREYVKTRADQPGLTVLSALPYQNVYNHWIKRVRRPSHKKTPYQDETGQWITEVQPPNMDEYRVFVWEQDGAEVQFLTDIWDMP